MMKLSILKNNTHEIRTILDELIQLACQLGASDAAAISTREISIENDLAALCREPQCENYGRCRK